MKKVVDKEREKLLLIRLEIVRDLPIFTLKDIANAWQMSMSTIFRYNKEEYRELSRTVTRRNRYIKKDRIKCQICFQPIQKHERCSVCTQLIHDYSRDTHQRCIDKMKHI